MTHQSLAIITARGGSKRIPKKNIKNFLGEPIISYSIKTALQAGCFDEVMVSTDNQELAKLSKKLGASIPFYRSQKNSDDKATTASVILEVLQEYKKLGKEFEFICCIYPTAPFITTDKIIRSFKLIKKTKVDCIIPVVKFSYPIQRALEIKNNLLVMRESQFLNTMSQDLTPTFHDSGQFYWLKTASFLKQKKMFGEKSLPFEISELETQDIDTLEDWKLAELKYRMLKEIYEK